MTKLTDIEGVGEVKAAALQKAGVTGIEDLLQKCATPAMRKELAQAAGMTEKELLKWANRADLFRIKGVGEEYSDLLELAGVDTVPELAQRNAANLHAKLVEQNEKKKVVRQLPSEKQVAAWIDQAKGLPRVLTY